MTTRPLKTLCTLALLLGTTLMHTQSATAETERMPWPHSVVSSDLDPYILTPRPLKTPQINGTRLLGITPGAPVFFKIPVTGQTPIRYEADLPAGLGLDAKRGIIVGQLLTPGDYNITLRAHNELGSDENTLTIRVGDQIGLTPSMGWNSWNCWGWRVTQQNVEDSAHAMVAAGLIDHGWTYVNIDDTWQGNRRGGQFHAILPNDRFPDMQALVQKIHDLGLKAGIYSTPWVSSYAGYIGGSSDSPDGQWTAELRDEKRIADFAFDTNDAKQIAAWGFDYLKYDWNPNDVPTTRLMRKALQATSRDIIYSLSNSAPYEHATELAQLSDLARTTGDIRDGWTKHTPDYPYEDWTYGLIEIWDRHERWADHQRPGFFADADMLVVGEVSWSGEPKPSGLTPDEQYTHVSLWTLWASPLLIGCPLERLDRFTLSLLTNDEVIAVNQDPKGLMGRTLVSEGEHRVIVKPLADGSFAVGLFNRSDEPQRVTTTLDALNLNGTYKVRDLWRQHDLNTTDDELAATVNPHGVILLRLTPNN